MRRWLSPLCLLLAGGVLAGAAAPAAAQGEELPPGEGRELVGTICSGCHSLMLVQQQGLSHRRWDETLDYMVEEQGMPELDPETRAQILDYLAEHYGPER